MLFCRLHHVMPIQNGMKSMLLSSLTELEAFYQVTKNRQKKNFKITKGCTKHLFIYLLL